MARLKYMLEKEVKQFRRNSFLPRLALAFPVMVILIMPLVATMEVKDVVVTVVDNDHSQISERLMRKIAASGYFIMHEAEDTYTAAALELEKGRTDVILEIPRNMGRDLESGEKVDIQISVNAVNGTKGSLGGNYLSNIVTDFSTELMRESGATLPNRQLSVRYFYNPRLNYRDFMIPALMVMIVIALGGFLPAINIVSEKEIGTIEQINVSPILRWEFILAKLIPFWVMGFIVLTLCLLLAYLIHGLAPAGNVLIIYAAALLFIFVMSGFGLVVSNYSGTMQQAVFMMFFFVILFMLMSGLFTPIRSMPDWAQKIATFLPPRYFIEVLRDVYLKGSGIRQLYPQFLYLAGFATFFCSWAVISYRKRG